MKTLVRSYIPTKHSLFYGSVADTDTLQQRFRVTVDGKEVTGEISIRKEKISLTLNELDLLSPEVIIDIYKLSVFSSLGLKYISSSELLTGQLHILERKI